MKKFNYVVIILIGLIVVLLCALVIEKNIKDNTPIPYNPIDIKNENDFDFKMIKETNNLYTNQNYMISPLSIAHALSMLKDGASGDTKNQINNLLGN